MFGELSDDDEAIDKTIKGIAKSITVLKDSPHIKIYDLDGVKVDFVDYSRYPWIDDAIIEDGLRLASPKELPPAGKK